MAVLNVSRNSFSLNLAILIERMLVSELNLLVSHGRKLDFSLNFNKANPRLNVIEFDY